MGIVPNNNIINTLIEPFKPRPIASFKRKGAPRDVVPRYDSNLIAIVLERIIKAPRTLLRKLERRDYKAIVATALSVPLPKGTNRQHIKQIIAIAI